AVGDAVGAGGADGAGRDQGQRLAVRDDPARHADADRGVRVLEGDAGLPRGELQGAAGGGRGDREREEGRLGGVQDRDVELPLVDVVRDLRRVLRHRVV